MPAFFGASYVAVLTIHRGELHGNFSTLAGMAQLFSSPWALLAGWIHYLAFDLLAGSWQAEDASLRHVPWYALVPCLILTFLFGPAGLLLYFAIRPWWKLPA